MTEKINIAELLKDCPKGTELYSPLFGELKFEGISHTLILCRDVYRGIISFEYDGKYIPKYHNAECMLFPSKDQRDWSKFQSPFKDGDILVSSLGNPFIFKKLNGYNVVVHCALNNYGRIVFDNDNWTEIVGCKLATEEEKEKLFQAIKANGYKWNAETKTLEKSNSFYTGEVLVSRLGNIVLLSHVDDKQIIYYHCILEPFGGFKIPETPNCGVGKAPDCYLASDEQRDRLFDRLKKSGYKYNPRANKLEKLPSFKVGNRIRSKISKREYTIRDIKEDVYIIYADGEKYGYHITFNLECNYELIPDKFDINTLKPFDKVLVRLDNANQWYATLFSHIDEKLESFCRRYVTVSGKSYTQMIPYEGNEHLRGTKDNCEDYYKTW